MREVGRGLVAVGKFLLANVAVLAFWLALGLMLSLVFGVADRFDGWVRDHRISPTLIVAATAFLTVCAHDAWREQKGQQAKERQTASRDLDPPRRTSDG
jgi:hypothetical protein